ncbi:MAG: hypothetical protein AAF514_12755 [Verrucomicrobiota bacterium]
MHEAFNHSRYLAKKKFFSFLGDTFKILDSSGNEVLYCKLKAFKLKEDIRIFSDTSAGNELLRMSARSVLDFGATYDVYDSGENVKLGALRRNALKSFIKDEWAILDTNDSEIGTIKEDSGALAIVRRIIPFASSAICPQVHVGDIGGQPVLQFRQTRNIFRSRKHLDFSMDTNGIFDRRLGIAAAILFAAIEGKQD